MKFPNLFGEEENSGAKKIAMWVVILSAAAILSIVLLSDRDETDSPREYGAPADEPLRIKFIRVGASAGGANTLVRRTSGKQTKQVRRPLFDHPCVKKALAQRRRAMGNFDIFMKPVVRHVQWAVVFVSLRRLYRPGKHLIAG